MSAVMGESANDPNIQPTERYLRVAETPPDLFPVSIDQLNEETIRAYDKQALRILGAVGVQASFETLDQWLRFSTQAAAEIDHSATETTAVHGARLAARYIVKHRMHQMANATTHDETLDPNLRFYRQSTLFRDIAHEMQAKPNEAVAQNRVRLAKISVMAHIYHIREQNRQDATERIP